jgi:actin-related protein 10
LARDIGRVRPILIKFRKIEIENMTSLFRLLLTNQVLLSTIMSGGPSTPRGKPPLNPTTPTARLAGTHVVQASPHYTTTRRHSLYGTEDRVIIDPGSRIWKVGFSGEGRPRDVFYAAKTGTSLWDLSRAREPVERAEQEKLLEVNLERCLRSVFHQYVLCLLC